MDCCMYVLSRDAQLQDCQQKILALSICTLHNALEITNGQLWQNSSQNSFIWRGAECRCMPRC
jgi:hypothetical protein